MPDEPTPMTREQLLDLRSRIVSGVQPSREELRAAIAFLRENRLAAAEAKPAKKKSTPMSDGDLLKIFGG